MRKRIAKSLVAAMLISSMAGTTVFADDVTDLTNKKNQAQTELDQLQSDLSYLMTQMSDLELKMASKNDEIAKANTDLDAAQKKQDAQYQDMKLRIKYMYEDQAVSISEALLTAENMSDALNKAEYVQQVYNYDRTKLDEMAQTAKTISDLKTQLETDKTELDKLSTDMTTKQALLYTTIDEKKADYSNIDTMLADATKAAAQKAAEADAKKASEAANRATSSGSGAGVSAPTTANNNSAVASKVVSLAYGLIGVPYVSGGSSPSGFDCSGFTSYLFRQCGITVSRSSSAQLGGGAPVNGLANAQPGDIICYPGHVALYIGGGQIIHAPVPGDHVKIASATGINLSIIGIRRYW